MAWIVIVIIAWSLCSFATYRLGRHWGLKQFGVWGSYDRWMWAIPTAMGPIGLIIAIVLYLILGSDKA